MTMDRDDAYVITRSGGWLWRYDLWREMLPPPAYGRSHRTLVGFYLTRRGARHAVDRDLRAILRGINPL